MKEWKKPELQMININETAFGPYNPNKPDSEKTQVTNENGETGWEQKFGDKNESAQ